MAQQKPLTPVISILNMKGGVGKTTIAAHVFREAYRVLMKRTLLIDFDPQFNLTQTVMTRTRYEALQKNNKTILSVLEDQTPPTIFDICQPTTPAPDPATLADRLKTLTKPDDGIYLDLIPGDFRLTKFALASNDKLLISAQKRFLEFIAKCREHYDLICIDCNPSSSFMTLCALHASTHLLVPVRPDRYSVLGLELLNQFIDQVPNLPKKPDMMILINGVSQRGGDPKVETALRGHSVFGPATLANRLMSSKVLEARHDSIGFATDRKAPNKAAIMVKIRAVANEIGKRL